MQVILKNVRLAFPEVFEAKQFKGEGKPRFGTRVLLEKGSAQLKQAEDAINEVGKAGVHAGLERQKRARRDCNQDVNERHPAQR